MTSPATGPVRRFALGGIAMALIVGLGGWAIYQGMSTRGPADYSYEFPADYIGQVWFTVTSPPSSPRTVTVTWGRLTTTFEHPGGKETYFFDRGGFDGRRGPLLVTVDPAAEDVSFGYGVAAPGMVDIGATAWTVIETPSGTLPPRPANADQPTAEASVDEWVSYGLDVVGVGVRTAPELKADKVTVVHHGERYEAVCWVKGQELTNGNWTDPSDNNAEYTSDIWYLINTPDGQGYISDVWFSRRGLTDRLNLPECPK